MSDTLKDTVDAIGRAVEQFKAEHTKELAEVKARGQATAEQAAKVEAINAQITTLTDQLEAHRAHVAAMETAQARLIAEPSGTAEAREREREGAVGFFAKLRSRSLDEVRASITDADLSALRTYRSAFATFLRRGGNNGDALTPEVRAAMSVGSDPEGGYLVPPDLSGRIATLVYETSPVRQIASVQGTRSDRLKGDNDLGEASGGWVSEQGARATTASPAVGKWEIPVHEVYANPKATQQDIDDSIIDMEAWLVAKVSAKLARLEATAFVTGTGVGKPRGFTTYGAGTPSATTWNVVEQTNTGVNGGFHATLPGDVFHTVIGLMKADYLPNFRWVMNRTVLAAARKLKDGDGTYLWEKSFQAAQPFQILGYPVTLAEDMAALATNSLSIAGGDFKAAYQIVDRMGIRVLRDPYTDKPFVQFYSTKRVGGDVVNFEAIKLIKFAT